MVASATISKNFGALAQADELTNSPQRPADQSRAQPAALGHPSGQAGDHGFGFGLAGVELRDRVKIISIQSQIVADHSEQVARII